MKHFTTTMFILTTSAVVICLSGPQAEAHHSPVEWYSPTPLDDTDGDKIEDLIVQTTGEDEPINIVVCFLQDCVPDERIADLQCLGELGYCSTVVASVGVRNITLDKIAIIAGWPEVGYIHLDHIVEKHLTTAGLALGAHSGFFSPNTAEDLGYDGSGVTIAVLDTGCDDPGGPGTTHNDLPAAVGGVFVLDAPGGLVVGNPDDENGHGTAVAGCALGRGDMNGDNRGMAPGAQLFDCRITPPTPLLGPGGMPDTGRANSTDIQRVVDWLTWNHKNVDPPVRAANISFGSSFLSSGTSLTASIEALVSSGVVVCVSAGNHNSCPNKGIGHIAVASRAITVAAATYLGTIDRADDVIAPYSAEGPGIGLIPKPDLTAYGNNCGFTCVPSPQCTAPGVSITAPASDSETDYGVFGGTSAASPMVAGAAALIIERTPTITPPAVKKLLMDTAEDKGPANRWGAGLMDLSAIFIDQIPIVSCDLRVKSLSFVPMPMIPNSPVDITIVIENVGIAAVEDFCVDWERWYFGPNAFPTKHFPIGGGPERNAQGLLMPGNTRTFLRSWTPGVSDHLPFDGTSCFWGRVIALCDTNVSNNQRTVNTHLDSLSIGGRSASGGTGGDMSEVEFRLGHDRFGIVNMQVSLLNPDPSSWLAELDIEGQVGQTLVIPVDNQECAVWGILRTTRLTPTAASVEITVSASDGAGAPLGDMTISVVSGDATIACCFSGDFCAELTRANCASAGGVPDDLATDCNRSSGACAPQLCSDPGDMNGDGLFNGEDLQEFIDCLLTPGPNCICADVNLNGMLDDGDIPEIVNRMLIATACP